MKRTSARQFAIFRIALGIYLAVHFAFLLPYGAELFSDRGVLPDPALNFTHGLFPNILSGWDSPFAVTLLLLALTILSIAFATGIYRRVAAALLWFGWACLFDRNNLINNPSIPYVGLILVLSLLIPVGEAVSPSRSDRGWEMPPAVYWAAWVLLMAGYTFSGWMKLQSPSWIDGSAMQHMLDNPLVRPGVIRDLLLALPNLWLRVLTWGILALELLALPLSLSRKTRMISWCLLTGMNLVVLFVINFADLTVGMLMIHAFTFDHDWWCRFRESRIAGLLRWHVRDWSFPWFAGSTYEA